MRMLFLAAFFVANSTIAQVGIGTNAPSANSVLDVTSTNKGILLPRVNDTAVVGSPSAGLMIYNKATNAPAFHDGTRWNTVAARAVEATADSVTYTITNAATDFSNGTFNLQAVSTGIANAGSTISFASVTISKMQDINTIGFTRAVTGTGGPQSMVIEIKKFIPGAVTPSYSLKLSNLKIQAYSISLSSESFGLFESISILPLIYGYKDWINNKSFAYNTTNNQVVTY